MTAPDTDVPLLSDIGRNNSVSVRCCHLLRMTIMNKNIETLIRQYKKEPEVEDQINILVLARQEIDQLHKTLAKTIR
jgi:hypothetical protein